MTNGNAEFEKNETEPINSLTGCMHGKLSIGSLGNLGIPNWDAPIYDGEGNVFVGTTDEL